MLMYVYKKTHQDTASETLQKVQQLPPVSQIGEHVFDGRLPCLETSQFLH